MNTNTVRTVRKVGRPRPLKISTERIAYSPSTPPVSDSIGVKRSITDTLNDLEDLHISISNGNYDDNTARDIAHIYNILKSRGSELDASFKEQIDRYFVTLRNISREDHLDVTSRLRLLEVIELRARKWKSNENVELYYKDKNLELQHPTLPRNIISAPIPPPIMPAVPFMQVQSQVLQSSLPPLEPGEVLRSSGKFAKPTKVAGKNYYKDEIIIRNSDSGKVNPGARDRLVQITGPHEEAISHAKMLVEDTIRRNASPIREKREQLDVEEEENGNLNCFNQNYYDDSGTENFAYRNPLSHSLSMSNASLGKYTFNISVGEGCIEISGENVELVKEAKLVLEEYFTGQAEIEKDQSPHVLDPVSSFTNSYLSDMTKADCMQHHSVRSNIPLPGETGEKAGSPFYSSSEDEAFKSTSVKSTPPVVPSAEVSSSTACYPSEIPLIEMSQGGGNEKASLPNLYACEKITYSREFLLKCAEFKYSHVEPKGFSKLAKDFPHICKEPAKMFDPEEYKEQFLELQSQAMENSGGNEKQ